ncbi:helix-turn-helix domain-containing protein [Phytohabitans houttuyneae]|uniref:Transcriptional regulator n=1 Tax=Phytohabitans houttuyneae TaxID=1076126 RepID=A0A6V8KQZ1_9ACTN|nr:helix-turn-helix transcriptional regulator [Phytohabitans houttuyneae]GFJ85038.1 transcriptional regulator [Phytohabitans houttuyneae]
MDRDLDPTVQRRRLQVALREARIATGLTQREVAEALDWSLSKVIRIETGQVSISMTDLRALLDQYEINDPKQTADLRRMAQAGKKQTWSNYKDVLAREFVIYLGYESAASILRQFESTYVPGLLQTEEYMRALIKTLADPGTSDRVIERQIEARLRRRSLLQRADSPQMFFILDEAVVRRWVGTQPGDPKVMRQQLRWLKEMGSLPAVSIQIIPFTQGAHFGTKGPFVLLEFPDARDDDLLFLENSRRNVVTRDDADEIEVYKSAFFDLEKIATQASELDAFLDGVLDTMPG